MAIYEGRLSDWIRAVVHIITLIAVIAMLVWVVITPPPGREAEAGRIFKSCFWRECRHAPTD